MLRKWDYESPFVRDRLDTSLKFISRFVPADFGGVFVEIGAHNGDFTKRLIEAFPKATIAPSDISDDAWPADLPLHLQRADMLTVTAPPECESHPTVLLMLECLYYLSIPDRERAVDRLAKMLPHLQWAFVSGPVSDPIRYFDEAWLRQTFADAGMAVHALSILNTTEAFRSLYSWNNDPLVRFCQAPIWPGFVSGIGLRGRAERLTRLEERAKLRLLSDAAFRKKYAHQVMYAFDRRGSAPRAS